MTTKKLSHNFKQRLLVSSVGVLILLMAIYFSFYPNFKPIFAILAASAFSCALWEYYQIAIAKGMSPLIKLGIISTFVYVFATLLHLQGYTSYVLPLIVLAFSLLSFSAYYLFSDAGPLLNLSATTFGIVYLVLPLTLMLNINYFFGDSGIQDGRWWLFYLLAVSKMTDTGAYFIGKKFGKNKLAPHISPKKTIEGAIGGMAFSIFTSLLFATIVPHFTDKFDLPLWCSLWLGIAIGLLAQIGDLVESLLKRDGGIKDSNQLPGLGGMLDIVDSLVFTTPIVYFYLKIMYG